MIRFYFIGVSILFWAIVANGLAIWLGIKTWYEFLEFIVEKRGHELNLMPWDWVWLFLGYPLTLGASAGLGDWIYKQIHLQ
ncbi:MAG: DUF7672 family protein [Flavobacteriaceae bacterium]